MTYAPWTAAGSSCPASWAADELGLQLSDTRRKGILRHEHLDPLQQGSDQGVLVGGRGGRVHATLESHPNTVVDPKIRPIPAASDPIPPQGT